MSGPLLPVPLHIPVTTAVLDEEGKLRVPWIQLLINIIHPLQAGFTGTRMTAKLTSGGTEGTDTYQNGVLINQVPPT